MSNDEPQVPGEITDREREVLSRSLEYRNSVALAEAMKSIRNDHSQQIQKHDLALTDMQLKIIELEHKLASMTGLVMSALGSGPTSR